MLNLADLRRSYSLQSFTQADAHPDPLRQFEKWFKEAADSQVPEPNAMVLATVSNTGQPAARTMLLKGFDERGFIFFTNYHSRKGGEIAENPAAALLFVWLEVERQVRIEGKLEKIPVEESRAYFESRPKGSQIGAWASPQSQQIANRQELEAHVADITAQYADAAVLPLPPSWGGYVLRPHYYEFWQGRENRLHDRIEYLQGGDGVWRTGRLAP